MRNIMTCGFRRPTAPRTALVLALAVLCSSGTAQGQVLKRWFDQLAAGPPPSGRRVEAPLYHNGATYVRPTKPSPPTYQPPAYNPPAGFTPPVYTPPTYTPPAYSPPTYTPPATYAPPTYTPPTTGPSAYVPPQQPSSSTLKVNDSAGANRRWVKVAESGEGRTIEAARFGQGPTVGLIVGPLAGDEPAALAVMDKLALALESQAAGMTQGSVVLLRDPNPDGRVHRTRHNARRVDLDANFPAGNWRKQPDGRRWTSGDQPSSEPETRTVLQAMNDARPPWVVQLAAHDGPARVDWSGPGDALIERVVRSGQVAKGQPQAGALEGSLAAFGGERAVPVLVLSAPNDLSAAQAWNVLGPALLDLCGVSAPAVVTTPYSVNRPGQTLPPSSNPGSSAAPQYHDPSRYQLPPSRPETSSPSVPPPPPPPKARITGAQALEPWRPLVRLDEPSPTATSPPTSSPPATPPSTDRSAWPTSTGRTAEPGSSEVRPLPASPLPASPLPANPLPSSTLPSSTPPPETFWPASRIERLPPVWQQAEPGSGG